MNRWVNSILFNKTRINFFLFFLIEKGYKFSFPFLDDDCGLHIDENYISPLYKHCINAEHTTMALIGYVFSSAITQMIDIQVTVLHYYSIAFA